MNDIRTDNPEAFIGFYAKELPTTERSQGILRDIKTLYHGVRVPDRPHNIHDLVSLDQGLVLIEDSVMPLGMGVQFWVKIDQVKGEDYRSNVVEQMFVTLTEIWKRHPEEFRQLVAMALWRKERTKDQ